MAWIRLDCSCLSDEWILYELTPAEFKAWMLFLLRVKAEGSRGSVAVTSARVLASAWGMESADVASMIRKVVPRKVEERDKRWQVLNWWKFQEDHKRAFHEENPRAVPAKGEFPEDAGNGAHTTLPHTTLQNTTPQHTTVPAEDKDVSAAGWEMVLQNEWGIPFTRIPAKTLQEISELSQKHGKPKTLNAIGEARKYNKMSVAYVRAILEPRSNGEKIREQLLKQEQERAKK